MQRLMKLDFVEPRPPFIQYSLWPSSAKTSASMRWNLEMQRSVTRTISQPSLARCPG